MILSEILLELLIPLTSDPHNITKIQKGLEQHFNQLIQDQDLKDILLLNYNLA